MVEMNVNILGSGLVDDEWSYPAEEHVSSPQRRGEDVSLTPLGLFFFSDGVDVFRQPQ